MSFFKIIGGIALGVGAVAAAPFTDGGSVIGAASLLGSLAGAGTIAAAATAAAGVAGYALSEHKKEEQNTKISNTRKEGEAAGKLLAKEECEKN